MKYILYPTKEEALQRSEQEAAARGFAFHVTGQGTRYVSSPYETLDGSWALPVTNFKLSEAEEESTVDSFTPPAYEDLI